MKRLVLILTVLAIFCSCCQNVLTYKNRKYYSEDNTIKIEGYHKKNLSQTQTINVNKKHDLKNLNLNFCDTFSVEITGLYPILDTLPNALEERTFVKSLLTKNGFIQTDWGRGNWENGPRFLYLEYRKDNCICKVFKKYYYNQIQKDSAYNLRVTERIICNSDMYMDE